MSNSIYLIVGKSGSGKDTIVNELVKRFGLRRLDSWTTRPRRNLNDRHFFTDDFEEWKRNNPDDKIVGYTLFNGYHYWASQSQVDGSDLYVIDPAGVEWMSRTYTGSKVIYTIYVDVPARERFARMCGRGDGALQAVQRILHDQKAFDGFKQTADFVVHNDRVEDSVDDVWNYIKMHGGV